MRENHTTVLRRGEYTLGTQAQAIARDLTAERILRHPGEVCFGYRLSEEQSAELTPGTISRRWFYDYIIYAPSAPGTAWTASHTADDLAVWAAAYGISYTSPEPGERFDLTLPVDASAFQPLTGLGGWWVIRQFGPDSHGQREAGPYGALHEASIIRDRLSARDSSRFPLIVNLVTGDPYTEPCGAVECISWNGHYGDHIEGAP